MTPGSAAARHGTLFHTHAISAALAKASMRKPEPTSSKPSKKQRAEPPRMPPPSSPDDPPFVARVMKLVYEWVQDEWIIIQTLKAQLEQQTVADLKTESALTETALNEAYLTPDNLAARLDNMSLATLRRHLRICGAETPGTIIKNARLDYAKHLLSHPPRQSIKKIAARAGYDDDGHFGEIFKEATGFTPTRYRRKQIFARRDAEFDEIVKNPPPELRRFLGYADKHYPRKK